MLGFFNDSKERAASIFTVTKFASDAFWSHWKEENLAVRWRIYIVGKLLKLYNWWELCNEYIQQRLTILKPTGYAMLQQFNIQQLYALPTLYLFVCIYVRTNSDLYNLQNKLMGFYNRDKKCLQPGTDWVFK